jgi:hypothetical protein
VVFRFTLAEITELPLFSARAPNAFASHEVNDASPGTAGRVAPWSLSINLEKSFAAEPSEINLIPVDVIMKSEQGSRCARRPALT